VDHFMPLGGTDPDIVTIVDQHGRALFRVAAPPGGRGVLIEFPASGQFVAVTPEVAARFGDALRTKAAVAAEGTRGPE
jgi:hypothetical protein